MQRREHPLISPALGTQRSVTSLHFGRPGARPRVYLQAGLHADELPGLLVMHHLRPLLERCEAQGLIRGEIVLVPIANPVGLAQQHLGLAQGRYDAQSGRNFNRGFPNLADDAAARLAGTLDHDATANAERVRTALQDALRARRPASELEALQQALFGLALASDVVLDLHCDSDAAMHLYVHSSQLDTARALAGYLSAAATLHAERQGGQSFDDSCSSAWQQVQAAYPAYPIPLGCFAATVELRGQADVDRALAEADASALLRFLTWSGALEGEASPPPEPPFPATPLAGTAVVIAPTSGVVVYRHPVGGWVDLGMPLVDLIDPLHGHTRTLCAEASGVYYARATHRFAHAGAELCFIAGREVRREGGLLSN